MELGICVNRRYFLRTQVLDLGNLEGSSGLLINIHEKYLSTPHLVCPLIQGLKTIRVLKRAVVSSEAGLGKAMFPNSRDCRQNSVPVSLLD